MNSHELLEKKREIEEKLKTYNCEKNNPSVPRILMNEMYEIKESCLDLHNPLAKKYKMGSIESNPKASDSLKEHYKKLDQISQELNSYYNGEFPHIINIITQPPTPSLSSPE